MTCREAAGFTEVPHMADKAIDAWGPTLPAVFEAAARGMFALMADLDAIETTQVRQTTLSVDDLEVALVDWLSELLYQREVHDEVYTQFEVTLEEGQLHASFAGGPATPTGAVVKAATFHDLRLAQDEAGCWRARIVFDT